jgi:hypothetical protein
MRTAVELAALVGALWIASTVRAASEEGAVFELRTYTTLEGRLPALEARFRNHTLGLFEKHGMRNVGYWTPEDQPNTLIYLIAHASHEAATASWQAFISDPAWQAVAAESTRDGPILVENGIQRQFLRATDFSPIQ